MALSASFVRVLPITSAIIYLVVGILLGPLGFSYLSIDPIKDSWWLEIVSEAVVIISLFGAGLKLRLPFKDRQWIPAVRLAFISMALTVGLITVFGVWCLGLSIGASVLLGAILAPTDPVLATDVQVRGPDDREHLRFHLTGEAGLNDGTAFPFVMLGLGLLGLHEIGDYGWRWFAVDVVWAVFSGLAVGFGIGTAAAKLVDSFRSKYIEKNKDVIILDSFFALGIVGLSYGLTLLIHGYGFLAVFAAGLAIRRIERLRSGEKVPDTKNTTLASPEEIKKGPHADNTPAVLANAALSFDEELERIGEVGAVIIVGSIFAITSFSYSEYLFIPFLILFVRPISVWLGLIKCKNLSKPQKYFISWFGIRGIGSLYYLMYAIQKGIPLETAETLSRITFAVIAVSILVHGISVTPLMEIHKRKHTKTDPQGT